MAYFNYNSLALLQTPSGFSETYSTVDKYGNISTTTTTTPTTFNGSSVNLNFYNLAISAIDNTTRITILESKSQSSGSGAYGYVLYNGNQESLGGFYGGSTLTLGPGSGGATIASGVFNGTTKYGFRIAVNGAISSSGGVVNTTSTLYSVIKLDGTSNLYGATNGGVNTADSNATYGTPSAFITYLQNTLVKSLWVSPPSGISYSSNKGMVIQGNPTGTYSSTWGAISASNNKSFYVYWNNGYAQNSIAGNTNNVLKITLTSPPANNGVSIAGAIQSAINSAIAGTMASLSVVNDGTYYYFIGNSGGTASGAVVTYPAPTPLSSTNPSVGGVYEVTLAKDVVGDGSNSGILDWLGWTTLGVNNTVQVFDYNKIITPSLSSSNKLILSGTGPYASIAFYDSTADSYPGLLSNYLSGVAPTSTTIYYQTQTPQSSWSNNVLNFGGNLNLSTLATSGTATFGGAVTFNSSVVFNNTTVTVPGGFKVLPSYVVAPGFSVTAGQAVAIYTISSNTTPYIIPADNSSSTTCRCIGITLNAGSVGQTVNVIAVGTYAGFTTAGTWAGCSLTPGNPIFLGNNGQVITNASAITNGAYRQLIGQALNTTDIFINIAEPALVASSTTVPTVRSSYYGLSNSSSQFPLTNNGSTYAPLVFITSNYDLPTATPSNYYNGTYTAPMSGTYEVSGAVRLGVTTSSQYSWTLQVYCNTETHQFFGSTPASNSGFIGQTFTCILALTAGETVTLSIVNSASSGSTITYPTGGASDLQNFVQFTRVGP